MRGRSKRWLGAPVAIAGALAVWTVWSQEAPPERLVVHEWGTFTSMQGSDGVSLEGLHHEEEALPYFVYSRREVRECPLREYGYKGLEVDVSHVTEKMETPVIYFYADKPLRARARVCFEGGLLSQWFPVSDLLGPPERSEAEGPLDMRTVERSFLEWEFDVLAPGEAGDRPPGVDPDDPWRFARIPDSNVLRTTSRSKPRMGPVEHERFLFYRGLGRFELPLRAETQAGSRLVLENQGAEPLKHLFVLHVREGRGEFSYLPELAGGATREVTRPLAPDAPPLEEMLEILLPALQASLVAEGLYPQEAEAMTLTWQKSYFHTPGLRVLYIVPRSLTDAILPLELVPTPTELVRVLVGRLECIAPEAEEALAAALLARSAPEPERRARAQQVIDGLGRFLEPHLRRVLSKSSDPAVQAAGRELLAAAEAEATARPR